MGPKSLIDAADANTSIASSHQTLSSQFCIGDLEHDLHNTFAANRTPHDQYVYVNHGNVTRALNDFCDEKSFTERINPLVVAGSSGVGKSSVLANWLLHHQSEKRRNRGADEFVFWHVVGCSRQSTYTYQTLRRLMTELKHHFELPTEVHANDEKLPWDFPRFLELAAKKGRIVIIIDGLHRLRTTGGDLGLKWLLLSFPPNVRLILSTTSPSMDPTEGDFDTGNAEDDAVSFLTFTITNN